MFCFNFLYSLKTNDIPTGYFLHFRWHPVKTYRVFVIFAAPLSPFRVFPSTDGSEVSILMDGLAPCKGGFHAPSLVPSGMERGDVDYGTDCFLSFLFCF